MNKLLMTIIVAAIFTSLIESILPEGSIKKPAVGVVALVALAMVLTPFAEIFLKAKENRIFKGGDAFIEKNQK